MRSGPTPRGRLQPVHGHSRWGWRLGAERPSQRPGQREAVSTRQIAVDSQGNAYAAWQHFHGCAGGDTTGDIEFARQPAGAGWERPVRVSGDFGSSHASPPVIAAGRDGAAYLVWEEEITHRYVLFLSFRPPDGDWEPKTPIPDAAGNLAPAGPALAVDAEGNAYVTWLDTRADQPVIRFAHRSNENHPITDSFRHPPQILLKLVPCVIIRHITI